MFRTATCTATAVVVRRFVVLVKRHVVSILYGYFIITLIVTTIATPIALVAAVVAGVPRHGRFVATLLVVTDRLFAAVIVLNAASKEITVFFFGGDAVVYRVRFQYDVLDSRMLARVVEDVIRHSVNSRCLLLRFLAPILLMRLLLGDAFLTDRRRSPSQR